MPRNVWKTNFVSLLQKGVKVQEYYRFDTYF